MRHSNNLFIVVDVDLYILGHNLLPLRSIYISVRGDNLLPRKKSSAIYTSIRGNNLSPRNINIDAPNEVTLCCLVNIESYAPPVVATSR